MLFTSTICISFIVRSSSFEPAPPSTSTEGRMQTGGTGRRVSSRCSGRPARSRSSQSASGTAEKRPSTRSGLRSSTTLRMDAPSAGLAASAPRSSATYASRAAQPAPGLASPLGGAPHGSCTILSEAGAFFTTPLSSPQCGHARTRLQRSSTRRKAASRAARSPPRAPRSRRAACRRSSGVRSTRAHALQTHWRTWSVGRK